MDLEELREQWLRETKDYEALGGYVESVIEKAARERGIPCDITQRTKSVASLVRKALRKNYENPYEDIRDKVGVRATVTYLPHVQEIEDIVRERFRVLDHQDKKAGIDPRVFDYLGVHVEVAVLEEEAGEDGSSAYKDKVCEIQIRTRAQDLWAEVSHSLLYKPITEPPLPARRSIHRLVALLELFDKEVEEARQMMLAIPGYEDAQILDILQQELLKFTTKPTDNYLSLQIVGNLRPLLGERDTKAEAERLIRFVESRREKLDELYDQYREDSRCNLILLQPESLLIFDLLEADPFRVREVWGEFLPAELLEPLATIWGVSL